VQVFCVQTAEATTERKLNRHLSARAAWAFALGTSIGWGSLVVTSNTYLAEAGPWGSTLGMILGTLIMLLISRNYAYMMNCYPEAGGAYAYSREVFGHDHSFLTAWFLALTYLAILWANPPLFRFLQDIFLAAFLNSESCIRSSAMMCISEKRFFPLLPCCWLRFCAFAMS
jgi:amino acid transporter